MCEAYDWYELKKTLEPKEKFHRSEKSKKKNKKEAKMTNRKPIPERKGFIMRTSWIKESKNPVPSRKVRISRGSSLLLD